MRILVLFILILFYAGCDSTNRNFKSDNMNRVLFLHHSTGNNIWLGNTNKYISKLTGRSDVQQFIAAYNKKNHTNYEITHQWFPKESPYGWHNYPYDYYNIWVKNAGENPFMEEPTLEILTRKYRIIIFKNCYPVSNIKEDTGIPDINSDERRLENYKLQYTALKNKMHEFPDNKFIVWSPAVNVKYWLSEDEALRTREFYNWMINEWDEKGDNIYIWDFYKYETEGNLYMLEKYSDNPQNSHPSKDFSVRLAPLFAQFIIDVAQDKIN